MSFDILRALQSVKLYGLFLAILVIVAVLQPQKLVALLIAGDGAWQAWTAHIGADLWINLLAAILVTVIAWYFDLFELRRATGAGTRDLGSRR